MIPARSTLSLSLSLSLKAQWWSRGNFWTIARVTLEESLAQHVVGPNLSRIKVVRQASA